MHGAGYEYHLSRYRHRESRANIVSYAYTTAGRLSGRTWARGISTQYGYRNGDLETVSYNDGVTPGITNTFDRLGRPVSIARNGITTALQQSLFAPAHTESYSGGALDGVSVAVGSDTFLRRSSVTAQRNSQWLKQASYAYDTGSGRLAQIADDENVVNYYYLANSSLLQEVKYAKTANQNLILMLRRNSYDALNRLTATYCLAGRVPQQWNYSYDLANRRNHAANDRYFWDYTYDPQGQLKTASKLWQDDFMQYEWQSHSYVAGQQFGYEHDQIGNRTSARRGGYADGTGLRTATYVADRANKYASRVVPGAPFTWSGSPIAPARRLP